MALRLPRRRWAGAAGLLVAIVALLALFTGPVFAADPPASPATVPMIGQGTVVGGESSQQLRLKLSAGDGSQWLLEMTLNPLSARRHGEELVTYTLGGSFTLGLPDQPLATGTASGTMDQGGTGDIRLSGSGSTSLDVPFNVAGSGQISARVTGTWPALPVAAPAADPAAPPVNHTCCSS
jgi:hypothetical protein